MDPAGGVADTIALQRCRLLTPTVPPRSSNRAAPQQLYFAPGNKRARGAVARAHAVCRAVQAAVLGQRYECYIHPDTPLPMMYMPDCLRATWQLITAPRSQLTRCTYNVTAMSFTPAQLERSIRLCYPNFEVRRPAAVAARPVLASDSGVGCAGAGPGHGHTACMYVAGRVG